MGKNEQGGVVFHTFGSNNHELRDKALAEFAKFLQGNLSVSPESGQLVWSQTPKKMNSRIVTMKSAFWSGVTEISSGELKQNNGQVKTKASLLILNMKLFRF